MGRSGLTSASWKTAAGGRIVVGPRFSTTGEGERVDCTVTGASGSTSATAHDRVMQKFSPEGIGGQGGGSPSRRSSRRAPLSF